MVDALAAAERRVETSFGSQPEVAATVRRTLGQTYYGIGEYERAEKILRDAVNRSRAAGRQADLAADLGELAAVMRASGRAADSVAIAREAVEVGRAGVRFVERSLCLELVGHCSQGGRCVTARGL